MSPRSEVDLEREFDAAAPQYDRLVGLNPGYHDHLAEAARTLVAQLPTDRSVRVLDLGCGSGASTVALVDALAGHETADLLGVDASDGMLDEARRKSWPDEVRFVHAKAEQIPSLVDGGVDGALACYLFRNIDDRDGALEAVRQVLAPGGTLVTQEYSVAGSRRSQLLWTIVCWLIVIPLSLVFGRRTTLYRYLWRSVLRFDSVARFEQRLRRAGFTDIEVATVGGWQKGILHTITARLPD
ncbi:class I SAM-dependent methyltransferase [Jatrophihabitans fulvus]